MKKNVETTGKLLLIDPLKEVYCRCCYFDESFIRREQRESGGKKEES